MPQRTNVGKDSALYRLRIGKSCQITIPKELAGKAKLRRGAMVYLEYDEQDGSIRLRGRKKRRKSKSSKEAFDERERRRLGNEMRFLPFSN